MKKFFGATLVVCLVLGFLIVRGDSAEVRYRGSDCNYYLTYENTGPISLAGFGGSRMRTAFDADDLARILRDSGHPEAIVYNGGHSHYSIEKEYVLVRDLLETRQVKTVVVMLQPRAMDYALISRDFKSIARVRDIPTIVNAVAHESLVEGVATSFKVLSERLKLPEPVPSCHDKKNAKRRLCKVAVHREDPTRNCHPGDYRADLDRLLDAESRVEKMSTQIREWDPTSLENRFTLHFIKRIQSLAASKDTAVFFLFLYRTGKPFLPDGLSERFKMETGAELLIPPRDMVSQLAIDGRRDPTHMNSKGRALFLPWMIAEIKSRCPRADGCL